MDLFSDIGCEADGIVTLIAGAPSSSNLLRVAQIIDKGATHLLSSNIPHVLQYGPRQGSPRFRHYLAKFLSAAYHDQVNSDDLLLTSGATYGLHLVGSVLMPRGCTVFVEDPTFFCAINIIKTDLGCNVVAVPTDADGVDTDALDRLLTEQRAKCSVQTTKNMPFWSMVYLIPTFNNPRGLSYPPEKNRRLIEIARKHDVLLFCDDVYNLLHFDPNTEAPPRLLSYDKPSDPDYKGNVLSNASFSKIMGPGMRLGWIESGKRILEPLWKSYINMSAGAANHFMSEVVASCLELGLTQEYIRVVNAETRETVSCLNKVFEDKLPKCVTFRKPAGGYFYWLVMPVGAKGEEVSKITLNKFNITTLPGPSCSPIGQFENCVRVSFSHYERDILVDAFQKLCQAITEHLASLGMPID